MNTEPTNLTDYTAKITEAFRKLTEATGTNLKAALMRQRNLAPDMAATLTDRSAGAEQPPENT